jgi:single-strand DNA-binding protein
LTTNNYTGNKPQNISQIASKVVNFSVATNEWKKGQDGNKQQVTDWHNIKVFNKLADFALEYLDKGSSIEIQGRLKTDK